MYRGYDSEFGVPPIIYREPNEIRRDINRVKASIDEINSRLNIRGLVLSLINGSENIPPEKTVPLLEEMLSEAELALSKLKELKDELSNLKEELYEVRCAMQT